MWSAESAVVGAVRGVGCGGHWLAGVGATVSGTARDAEVIEASVLDAVRGGDPIGPRVVVADARWMSSDGALKPVAEGQEPSDAVAKPGPAVGKPIAGVEKPVSGAGNRGADGLVSGAGVWRSGNGVTELVDRGGAESDGVRERGSKNVRSGGRCPRTGTGEMGQGGAFEKPAPRRWPGRPETVIAETGGGR